MVGLRIDCPWCPSGTVRADLLAQHLRGDHGAGALEATEIAERLRDALDELPPAQAVVLAFTGMRLPPLDAREVLADMRRDAAAAAANRRLKQRRPRARSPQGYCLCLACMVTKPAREMATKPGGEPAVVCLKCHSILDGFKVPRWVLISNAI